MTVVTGLTAGRMKEIEAAAVVDATIEGNNLVLTQKGGEKINVGNVRGNPGVMGPAGGYFNDITFDDLPATGIVSAHRSGGGGGATTATVPEETVEGMWVSLALGAHILDIDVNKSADGTYVIMHDDSVDRTTYGYGLVADHFVSNMPPIIPNETSGSGWGEFLQVPTLEQVLSLFGGKCIITIEVKDGVPAVEELANLIKLRGLANSVFLNTNDVNVVAEIVSHGIRAHLWAWDDVSKIAPGIDNGASLVEVPWNADPSVVAACQAAIADSSKKLRWFVAGPTYKRSEVLNMTPGIMGHVSDLIGHTNRASDAPLIKSLRPSLMAGKRGIGWRLTTSGPTSESRAVQNSFNLIPRKGFSWKTVTGSTSAGVYLGDMSGTMPTSYTLALKFIPDDSFAGNANANQRFRFASTIPDATGVDTDSNGYVVIANGNGRLRLFAAGATLSDPTVLLYDNATAANFNPGSEYRLAVSVTPTSVAVSLTGSGISKSSGNIANAAYRGGHIYLWRVSTTNPDTYITDFART